MDETPLITVLFVEDAADTVRLVEASLARFTGARFHIVWNSSGEEALKTVEKEQDIDLILMDYYLPGMDGLETTRQLKQSGCTIPIVFLTVLKDVEMAVQVMKLGVRDYFLKDDMTSNVFPQTLAAVYEKRKLQRELEELEKRRSRLEAMQGMVVTITNEIALPLGAMRAIVDNLASRQSAAGMERYLGLIRENISRIELKMEKLKNLKDDRTVQYIKDIRMIDLS